MQPQKRTFWPKQSGSSFRGGWDNQPPNCLSQLGVLNIQGRSNGGSSLVQHVPCDHSPVKVSGAGDSQGSWGLSSLDVDTEIALNILSMVGDKGNRDNTNEGNRLSYRSTEIPQCLDVCKTQRNCFSCPAASTGK